MFRKLQNKISSHFSTESTDPPTSVQSITKKLTEFGFDSEDARQAAVATGTFNGALAVLTAKSDENSSNISSNSPRNGEDDDIAKAISASLDTANMETQRRTGQDTPVSRAAAAAELRAAAFAAKNKRNKLGNTTINAKKKASNLPNKKPLSPKINQSLPISTKAPILSHPNVTVPPPLASAPIHDQFVRCAERLASTPRALDALRRAMYTLAREPFSPTHRTIETGKGTMYNEILSDAPGASELLRAVGYVAVSSPTPRLHLAKTDEVVLAMAVSALEEAQKSDAYIFAKKLISFAKEVQKVVQSDIDEAKKLMYSGKIPSETKFEMGEGAQLVKVRVILHSDLTVTRNFDSDDTVGDMMNWVGTYSPAVAGRLWEGDWQVENITTYPPQSINCKVESKETLQGAGLWPSGTLRLCPCPDVTIR
eukprot:CAMPEP_0194304772 /NCGR_PEP_ID=MMETSP0171-20130528/2405_1 /TAXON_ID=218684 /ORGANISM="Corethron pennatum, Strain L29A3" /LENGTH=424 /DNA_ID=CAMNT_0039056123 /DNA_START=92 /DNA_END=1366 /DNA_ORIENTATION=-